MIQTPKNSGPSPHAKNHAARLAAVQALYEFSQNQQPVRTLVEKYAAGIEAGEVRPDEALLKKIAGGTVERLAEVSTMVEANVVRKGEQGKPIEPLLKSILLAGTYELMAHQDIDFPIIINDYINITRDFYGSSEAKMVNGVLDSLAGLLREKTA